MVDLVQSYVKLEKSGINFRGRCPFHQERTPSFFVSPTRQTWRCFGCNKGGDHFTFVQEIEGIEFPDALKTLADRAGIKLVYEDPKLVSERSRLYAICEEAAIFFEKNLWGANENKATPMIQYLLGRGMKEDTIKKFRVGFAPESWDALFTHLTKRGFKAAEIEKVGLIIKKQESRSMNGDYYDRYRNRIIFPIADSAGRIIAFGGRVFEPQTHAEKTPNNAEDFPRISASGQRNSTATAVAVAKYINSPETPIYSKSHILYAFDKAKQAIREKNQCIAVEGYMDTVMAHQAGAVNTVAVSGTALTIDQLKLISRLTDTVVFSFDMDAAGQSATKRSLELAADFDLQRKVLLLPSGKDPADAVRENPQIFLTALQNARPLMDYYFEEVGKRYPIKEPQGKKEAGAFFLPHIRALKNEIERAHWIQQFAHVVSVPESSVRQELEKLPRSQSKQAPIREIPRKKIRRELLEEQILALYLESPDVFQKIEKTLEEPIVFTSLAHERLFHELKKNIYPVSPELTALHDALQFQREMLDFKSLKLEEEIRSCMHTILTEHYKERRDLIQQQIQHLEKQGNRDKINELLSEFRAISTKIAHYSQ